MAREEFLGVCTIYFNDDLVAAHVNPAWYLDLLFLCD
jgi:hypothetical protein